MNYIFGLFKILIGIYIFLVASRKVTPKTNSEDVRQDFVKNVKKYQLLIMLFSIGLILTGTYNICLIFFEKDKIDISWTLKQKQVEIDKCISKMKADSKKEEELFLEFCVCYNDKVSEKMSYDSYKKLSFKSSQDFKKEFFPIIKQCYDTLMYKVANLTSPSSP